MTHHQFDDDLLFAFLVNRYTGGFLIVLFIAAIIYKINYRVNYVKNEKKHKK